MNTYRIELFRPDVPAKVVDVDALKTGVAIRRALDTVTESDVTAINCRLSAICVNLQPDHLRVRPAVS